MRVIFTRHARVTGPQLQAALANTQSRYTLNWGTQLAFGEYTINKGDAVGRASNKRIALETMSAAGVPTPRLYTPQQAREAITSGKVLVGRPDQHSKGRNFFLCRTLDEISRARKATHFLEFLEMPHELRVHVIGGLVVKIAEKVGGTGFIRNHQHGWRFMAPTMEKREPARQAARKAVEALGLDFGAVDVLYDGSRSAYVLEVNTAPSLTAALPKYLEHIKAKWGSPA